MNLSKGWDNWDKPTQKAARENGKRVNQTLITGGGKKVIVEKYGVDPAEVDQIWKDYFDAMPEVRTLQKRASKRWEENGFVFSLLGRRARLQDRRFSYAATNRLLQMGNADVIKVKLVELQDFYDSEGADIDILNNVHDAIDQQFDPGSRDVYERGLKLLTDFGPESALPLTIPMEIDTGEGKSWSEATWGAGED
jgi:DNA polymerase-1